MSHIKLIMARSQNGIIGKDGSLPWHLGDELKEFKNKTLKSVVVMGRKTYDGLPASVKPFPDRYNVVVSKDGDGEIDYDKMLMFINNPVEYFSKLKNAVFNNRSVWIIGGKSIYELALPFVEELHITTIMQDIEGDTKEPDIDFSLFTEISASRIKYDSKTNIPYQTVIYKRI